VGASDHQAEINGKVIIGEAGKIKGNFVKFFRLR
jgi:hypothetical protein